MAHTVNTTVPLHICYHVHTVGTSLFARILCVHHLYTCAIMYALYTFAHVIMCARSDCTAHVIMCTSILHV